MLKMTASLGLVALNHSEKYDLPPGDPKGPNTHVYQLSVVHQLQCLVSSLYLDPIPGKLSNILST
jgi:hypothetical protein